MQLVDVIEAEIRASVEAWPSNILTLLFAFDPHMPYALPNLQTVITFSLAIMCLSICLVNSSVLAASIPFLLSNISLHTHITCGPSILHHPPEVFITIYMRNDINTSSVRKVSDRIFLCEHLMDYNLARFEGD